MLVWRRVSLSLARKEFAMPRSHLFHCSTGVHSPAWHEELVETIHEHQLSRRRFLGRAMAAIGSCSLVGGLASKTYAQQVAADNASKALIGPAAAQDHQAGNIHSPQVGLREDHDRRGTRRLGRDAQGQEQGCRRKHTRWRRIW